MTPRRTTGMMWLAAAMFGGLDMGGHEYRGRVSPHTPPVFPKDPQEAMDTAAEKRRLKAERKAENARRSAAGKLRCERCKGPGGVHYRQDTKYVNEAENWATLCPPCREENDAYWAERWNEFYSDCL